MTINKLADGASLIYTTPFLANSLQTLIHSSLGIQSLLKRPSLEKNVIDRDKILVPSNWDSWGKIRIIREGFDIEGVSTGWSIEIQDPPEPLNSNEPADEQPQDDAEAEDGSSAVTIYEQTIKDPKRDHSIALSGRQQLDSKIEVETLDMQGFLSKQVEVLEQLKQEDERERATKQVPQLEMSPLEDNSRVNEHIGPVQLNYGGIQVDADDMLRNIKVSSQLAYLYFCQELLLIHSVLQEREASRSQRKEGLASSGDEKAHNQYLANFFAGLVKKPTAGSPRGSPSA